MFRKVFISLVILLLVPLSASARPLPVYDVPCGQDVRITTYLDNNPPAVQTYHVSYTVQGVGRAYFHQSNPWIWRMDNVNAPTTPVVISFDWVEKRYSDWSNELVVEALPAPCAQYPDGMTFTNISIVPATSKPVKVGY